MPSPDLNTVTSLITAEHAKALMIDLARIPSPLTELLEAEPKLRAFIDVAVEPRLREMGLTDDAASRDDAESLRR
jgi:hypothetical protein